MEGKKIPAGHRCPQRYYTDFCQFYKLVGGGILEAAWGICRRNAWRPQKGFAAA